MNSVQTVHDWISNQQKVDAVMLNLEQIGETAKKHSFTKWFYVFKTTKSKGK
jgi:uncharacterized protein with HEPN domain